jgi:hydroxymethylpyrimidine pyrophosphatase-like HAD family hydrolase
MLLATDLDGTFLGGRSADKQQLYRVIRENPGIRLVFVTGRGLETVIPLLNDPVIPNPDYIICDVGATIVHGRSLEPIQPLQAEIENKWPGSLVVGNKLKNIPGLSRQEVPMTRRSSYFYNERTDMGLLEESAAELGCDVLISAGKYVDVLPPGVNKGFTLQQLVRLLNEPEEQILVAGDTLNDLSLFQTGYKGVVVGGAETALLEATRGQALIYQAQRTGCGGILEAFKSLRHIQPV